MRKTLLYCDLCELLKQQDPTVRGEAVVLTLDIRLRLTEEYFVNAPFDLCQEHKKLLETLLLGVNIDVQNPTES